jgi:O-antigen biosynthesis protein
MRSLREGWVAARNLLFLAIIYCRRESREIWNTHFNSEEYCSSNPDLARSALPAALHYLIFGNRELRDPSRCFDTRFYLARYPDVDRAGVNALVHFAAFGQREGRFVPGEIRDVTARVPNVRWPETEPLVSIVIPCYNYGEFVEETLRSAVDQTFTGVEIIVVEGGSDDGSTRQKVRDLEVSNPGVRFLYREERHFVGDNRNFGIAAARGRYICCLDADDKLDAIYIEVAVFLAEAFGYGLVYSSVRRLGTGEVLWRVKDTSIDQIEYYNDLPVPSLYRHSDWELVGGYRDWGLGEQYVSEDWDFWIRILALGRSTRAISEPLFEYRINEAGLTRQFRPIQDLQRKRLREANSPVFDRRPQAPVQVIVEEPLLNLTATSGQGRSVLFALSSLTSAGTESLFRRFADSAKEIDRLVITTMKPSAGASGDRFRFADITKRIYPLATLFRSDQERLAFVLYLIQRYRVESLVVGGSEAVRHWLPAIKSSFPDLAVTDLDS